MTTEEALRELHIRLVRHDETRPLVERLGLRSDPEDFLPFNSHYVAYARTCRVPWHAVKFGGYSRWLIERAADWYALVQGGGRGQDWEWWLLGWVEGYLAGSARDGDGIRRATL